MGARGDRPLRATGGLSMHNELVDKRIGFLGGGAMAQALASGLVASGVPAEAVAASDPDRGRRQALKTAPGIETFP